MEKIVVNGGENYPDTSKYPDKDDFWNSNISNVTKLNHVTMAGCISAALDILVCYPVIIVYPGTTKKDIMDDWWQIKEYRNKFSYIQGVFSKPELAFYQTVYRLNREFNMSYGEIAKFLNFEILVLLCAGIGLVEAPGNTPNVAFWIEIFKKFLVSYGYTIDEAQMFSVDATESLNQGKLPWDLHTGPYIGPKIREIVRAFEKLVNDENMIIDRKAD